MRENQPFRQERAARASGALEREKGCQRIGFPLGSRRGNWRRHNNDDVAFFLKHRMNANASIHVFEAFLFPRPAAV
jgi:hypothetical protein